jgi:hypothetical protein
MVQQVMLEHQEQVMHQVQAVLQVQMDQVEMQVIMVLQI